MSSFRKIAGVAALSTAILAGSLGAASTAAAAPEPPQPEISVTANAAGLVGDRYFEIQNQGNTVVPVGTTLVYNSNGIISLGLFTDSELNGYETQLLGSGSSAQIRTTTPIYPGQSKRITLAKAELGALSNYSLELTGPNLSAIDTNYFNNKATIRCTLNAVLLQFCTASNTGI